MDFFDHRYYKLGKIFMTLLGQWPYQSARTRRGILVVTIFVAMAGLPPPILALVRYRDDSNLVFECVIAGLFATASIMKGLGIIWNSQNTLKLVNRICKNWQVWARYREVNILHAYSEQGRKMTIVYTALLILTTAAVYFTIHIYTIQPMIQKIIDVVLKNGTELGKFSYPVDYYYFDVQKYYYYISLHCYISGCRVAIDLVASDNMLIIYMQHVCGVFAALGHKLEQIGNNDTPMENVAHLSSFIDIHNDAIEFANLIEATYTWNFFSTIGIGIILTNILGIQIVMKTNEPESTIKFIVFEVTIALVFYVNCNISQVLMDHSINLDFYIYNSQWHRLLPKDQKLLQLMIMRCRLPCQLTAGKVLIMTMRNFGLTLRTAMSYFAVVRPK